MIVWECNGLITNIGFCDPVGNPSWGKYSTWSVSFPCEVSTSWNRKEFKLSIL